jgi:hypothetical protein
MSIGQNRLNFDKKDGQGISYNIPAVYDGLPARIEKCAAFLGLANCGCSEPWECSDRRSARSGMT